MGRWGEGERGRWGDGGLPVPTQWGWGKWGARGPHSVGLGGNGGMGVGTRGTRKIFAPTTNNAIALHQLPALVLPSRSTRFTNHQQRDRASAVAWVGKPYQGRPFTNYQPPTTN
ncbi:MAG: hypothetical protein ACHBN1_27535 [Heteroscytonema crispum UTEX LB 1556]